MARRELGSGMTPDQEYDMKVDRGDRMNRFLMKVFYNLDKRTRVLEGKPAITRPQFMVAMKQFYLDV
jgi:hypothetical protein